MWFPSEQDEDFDLPPFRPIPSTQPVPPFAPVPNDSEANEDDPTVIPTGEVRKSLPILNNRLPEFDDEPTLPSSRAPEIKSPVHQDDGVEFRYLERIDRFKNDGHAWARTRHYGYWFLHNVVVHPLLGVFVNDKTAALHDLSSQWLNKMSRGSFAGRQTLITEVPEVSKRGMWLVHNCVAHPLIGLLPCKATFAFHDWTARKMNVTGWV